jgi:ornithine--oxo-acid transaminase
MLNIDVMNLINLQKTFLAKTYNPLNIVINRGKGIYLYDTNKNKYLDFLSGYSAINQGHSHPKIIKSAKRQLDRITITSRFVYNDQLSKWSKYTCNFFNYEKVLPINTGVEGVETAMKLARKFGYVYKGIETDKAKIITFKNNYHGRTICALSCSSNPLYRKNFGPYSNGFINLEYNNIESVKSAIESDPNICAVLVEPIQGEGGINVPDDGYLYKLKKVCESHNVLLIADEIQTGIGRTGKLLCVDYDNVKPDVLILGKSLGGGIIPISCVLSNEKLMDLFDIGSHGSTFGGNPLACAISMKSLEVIKGEGMIENAYNMGNYFRQNIDSHYLIKDVRGRGLLNGIEFDKDLNTNDICSALMKNGMLSKDAGNNTVRFCPPLIINKTQMDTGIEIINKVIKEL